jgi:hexosaminidase
MVLKFQLADQIADTYRAVYDSQKNPATADHTSGQLWNISGVNGLSGDLRDGYNYLRSRYSAVWLMENRPYWLRNVTDRYDAAAMLWMKRGDQMTAAREQWEEHHTLPPPQQLGIPPANH